MTEFLLIHGAWHGAWCWERVVAVLEAEGHRCVVPCLPGVGERAGELSEAVDLEAHAAEVGRVVAEAVEAHGRPLVAVAHSYAGAVLLAATEGCGEGLAARIFLDAVLVEDGESVMDQVPPEVARERIARARAGGGVPAIPPPSGGALGLTDPQDVAFAEARLTPHPLATYLQPARLGAGDRGEAAPEAPPSGYIACVRPPYTPISRSLQQAHRRGWPLWELVAGHDCMISAPQPTARALVEAAEALLALAGSRSR